MTQPPSDLATHAAQLRERYARTTWWRFVAVFFPVPLVLVLLRLELDAWHYYLAGGAYVAFVGGLFVYDSRLSARVDAAERAAADAAERRV